jgi:ribosomal protein L35AE/L33A
MVDDLLKCLTDEPTDHLTAFSSYLEKECDLKPKAILIVVEALMLKDEAKEYLGTMIIK